MKSVVCFDGRIGRARYFWRSVAAAGAYVTLCLIGGLVLEMRHETAVEGLDILSLVIFLPFEVYKASLITRRLHDIGRPGKHYWLLYVPFYGFYLSLLLLFRKGDGGRNQDGDDEQNRQTAMVLSTP